MTAAGPTGQTPAFDGWARLREQAARAGVDVEAAEAAADEHAAKWVARTDPGARVGQLHHTVPKFYLDGFADTRDFLAVRDRVTGRLRRQRTDSLGQRDFYTLIDDDGKLDAQLEDLLGVVEQWAAPSLRKLRGLLPGLLPGLPEEERAALATLLAFQCVRGPRFRRRAELVVEYQAKLGLRSPLTAKKNRSGRRHSAGLTSSGLVDAELAALHIAPDPNEHLRLLTVARELYPYLALRPVTVVHLAGPLLVTGDEPVVVGDARDRDCHRPECALPARLREKRARRAVQRGRPSTEVVHFRDAAGAGLAEAEQVWVPLTPWRLLLLGPLDASARPELILDQACSDAVAAECNAAVVAQSYSWVAAHPAHPDFVGMPLPAPGPLLQVCDGGSLLSRSLEGAPVPRAPQRRRPSDILRVASP